MCTNQSDLKANLLSCKSPLLARKRVQPQFLTFSKVSLVLVRPFTKPTGEAIFTTPTGEARSAMPTTAVGRTLSFGAFFGYKGAPYVRGWFGTFAQLHAPTRTCTHAHQSTYISTPPHPYLLSPSTHTYISTHTHTNAHNISRDVFSTSMAGKNHEHATLISAIPHITPDTQCCCTDCDLLEIYVNVLRACSGLSDVDLDPRDRFS